MITDGELKQKGPRLLAWFLLLILGISAIALGITISALGYQSNFVVLDSGGGGLVNLVFGLITLSVGLGLYLFRGIATRTWSLSFVPVVIVLVYAIVLLALGVVGLFVLIGIGMLSFLGRSFLRNKSK